MYIAICILFIIILTSLFVFVNMPSIFWIFYTKHASRSAFFCYFLYTCFVFANLFLYIFSPTHLTFLSFPDYFRYIDHQSGNGTSRPDTPKRIAPVSFYLLSYFSFSLSSISSIVCHPSTAHLTRAGIWETSTRAPASSSSSISFSPASPLIIRRNRSAR